MVELAPDFDDRVDNPALPTDYSVPQRLLDLQRAVLNQLMSETVAARILDSVGKADRPEAAFQLSELYGRLNRDIWSELAKGGPISATRRFTGSRCSAIQTSPKPPSPIFSSNL